jgi:hypothetical protein
MSVEARLAVLEQVVASIMEGSPGHWRYTEVLKRRTAEYAALPVSPENAETRNTVLAGLRSWLGSDEPADDQPIR